MATKLSLLSLSAILAWAPLGSCQDGEQTIVGDSPFGLYGIPTEDYTGNNANATGTITFDGYSLSIAVTADVPIAEPESGDPKNSTMATVISLAMDSPVQNQTSCVSVFGGLTANIIESTLDLASQDGLGCGQMLTDACISDLLTATNRDVQRDCNGYLPLWDEPQSCKGQFGDLNGSGWSIQSEDDQILYQSGTEAAEPGNQTLWRNAAMNIWPVFITTIVENGSSWSSETYLNCIRPDTFKEGTVRPSEVSNGTQSDDGNSTSTTDGPTPSPTNAASQVSLTVAVAVVGLIFNVAMLFM